MRARPLAHAIRVSINIQALHSKEKTQFGYHKQTERKYFSLECEYTFVLAATSTRLSCKQGYSSFMVRGVVLLSKYSQYSEVPHKHNWKKKRSE